MNTQLRLAGVQSPSEPAAISSLDACVAARGSLSPPRDAIDSWLAVLVSLLDLEPGERSALRDELESHLRERVRDLTLSGLSDAEASRQAISELGDAAAFARRYQQAIAPSKRRLIMNVAAISLAGAALLFSGIATLGSYRVAPAPCPPGEGSPETPGQPEAAELSAINTLLSRINAGGGSPDAETLTYLVKGGRMGNPSEDFGALRANVLSRYLGASSTVSSTFEDPSDEAMDKLREVEMPEDGKLTWREFFAHVAGETDTKPMVDWTRLGQIGFKPEMIVEFAPGATAADVLRNSSEDHSDSIAARLRDDRIFFAPQSYFDRQDQVLAAYDLSDLVARRVAVEGPEKGASTLEDVSQLLAQLVYPEQWQSNGGEFARVNHFGNKLFIQAPKRFHARIAWVMEQILSAGPAVAMGTPARDYTAPGQPLASDVAGMPADAPGPVTAPGSSDAPRSVPGMPPNVPARNAR